MIRWYRKTVEQYKTISLCSIQDKKQTGYIHMPPLMVSFLTCTNPDAQKNAVQMQKAAAKTQDKLLTKHPSDPSES